LIGKTFESNNFDKFKVKEKVGKEKYRVEFLKTGYETVCYKNNLKAGKVRDKYTKTVYGVGCLGDMGKVKNMKLYDTWHSIISRCYNVGDISYRSYGDKDVEVSDRWKCYANFREDAKEIFGWDLDKFMDGQLQIDKDLLQTSKGSKIYSKDTCIWLPRDANFKLKRGEQTYFIAKSPEGKTYVDYSASNLSRKIDIDKRSITSYIRDDIKNQEGWGFDKFEPELVKDFASESGMVVAVDFDNTIVNSNYPQIGEPKPMAVTALKLFNYIGIRTVIWTCRSNLEPIKTWLDVYDIEVDAINSNDALTEDEWEKYNYKESRKILYDVLIDDRNLLFVDNWYVYLDLVVRSYLRRGNHNEG
jgi:hypothetical protein